MARPFNLMLKTMAGADLEADGRSSGGRAILRLRDVTGYKRDIVKMMDRHRKLTTDFHASRALLNALPMPVWLKDEEGRIDWVNKAYVTAVDASNAVDVRDRQIELLESRQRSDLQRDLAQGGNVSKRVQIDCRGRAPHP